MFEIKPEELTYDITLKIRAYRDEFGNDVLKSDTIQGVSYVELLVKLLGLLGSVTTDVVETFQEVWDDIGEDILEIEKEAKLNNQ